MAHFTDDTGESYCFYCFAKFCSRSSVFVEMSRMRIEGLIAAFPKLLSSASGRQHTYVETEHVRYIYRPFEDLYLLLLTNTNSNIVEDLSTLRLLSKVVTEYGGEQGHVTESSVLSRAFELVFAFDEVVTAGGHAEHATLPQVRTNLEMDSHEERVAQMVRDRREKEAKQLSKQRAEEIRVAKREREQRSPWDPQGGGGGGQGRYVGLGSDSVLPPTMSDPGAGGGMPLGGGDAPSMPNSRPAARNPGFGSDSISSFGDSPLGANSTGGAGAGGRAASKRSGRRAGAGMKLGGGSGGLGASGKEGGKGSNRGDSEIAAAMAEEGISDAGLKAAAGGATTAGGAVSAMMDAAASAVADHVSVHMEEQLQVQMDRDGEVQTMSLKGTCGFTCHVEEATKLRAEMVQGNNQAFQIQTHPLLSRDLFQSEGVLSLRDEQRALPVDTAVNLLRWKAQGAAQLVPLKLICWPEEMGDGTINVNIEFNYVPSAKPLMLQNVDIIVPLGTTEAPTVEQCDGVAAHNAREGCLDWHIDTVDASNSSGTLEFSCRGRDPDAFFPVRVKFEAADILCDLAVKNVAPSTEPERSLRMGERRTLVVDSFLVE